MSENPVYRFELRCANCLKINKLNIPLGKLIKDFLSEGKECWNCKCKLTLEEKGKNDNWTARFYCGNIMLLTFNYINRRILCFIIIIKMKIQLNIFQCDICEKRSKICEEKSKFNAGYPYEDGWIYLYNFSFKDRKDKEYCLKDKHFCSRKCMELAMYYKLNEMKGGTQWN